MPCCGRMGAESVATKLDVGGGSLVVAAAFVFTSTVAGPKCLEEQLNLAGPVGISVVVVV
jgi:hypothetical protein